MSRRHTETRAPTMHLLQQQSTTSILDESDGAVAIQALVVLLAGRKFSVLTGAGISTESGIPDYRGPLTRTRARNPVRFQTFVTDDTARRRYWARAFMGWSRLRDAKPNDGHVALAQLERRGVLGGVITQNVDGLHRRAGSISMVELHGAMADVVCLTCSARGSREELQARLQQENPSFSATGEFAPDGDMVLTDEQVEKFVVVDCTTCGGPLKPDVVYFGEDVPKERVVRARAVVENSSALVVVGSSLEVFSGRRFIDLAIARKIPVAIVNLGPTRSDDVATVRVDAPAGLVLSTLARALGASSAVNGSGARTREAR